MTIVNKGFSGRRAESARQLPPGQHLTADFPARQAGPTPRIDLDDCAARYRHGATGIPATGPRPIRDNEVSTAGLKIVPTMALHAATKNAVRTVMEALRLVCERTLLLHPQSGAYQPTMTGSLRT
jgi:hypothetical protein